MEQADVIRIQRFEEMDLKELTKPRGSHHDVSSAVTEIIRNVRTRGDEALREYTARFDGVELQDFSVSEEEWEQGLRLVEPRFLDVLETAAARIRRYHMQQRRQNYIITEEITEVINYNALYTRIIHMIMNKRRKGSKLYFNGEVK